ncbi:MAG: LysM domain-containing protein [Peptococcaceae bacterium]|jgi:spore coat assembly protein SafA|nr:LysM domain-containing protein [Peptococcaceae bacterium]
MTIYVVQPGDTMSGIAAMFGVPLADLTAANPQIKDPNTIYPGQTVYVPAGGGHHAPPSHFYVVQKGDTMSSIADRYGLSVDALIKANPQIKDPDTIYPGQVIYIP